MDVVRRIKSVLIKWIHWECGVFSILVFSTNNHSLFTSLEESFVCHKLYLRTWPCRYCRREWNEWPTLNIDACLNKIKSDSTIFSYSLTRIFWIQRIEYSLYTIVSIHIVIISFPKIYKLCTIRPHSSRLPPNYEDLSVSWIHLLSGFLFFLCGGRSQPVISWAIFLALFQLCPVSCSFLPW